MSNSDVPVIFTDGFGSMSLANGVVRLMLIQAQVVIGGQLEGRPVGQLLIPYAQLGALIQDLQRVHQEFAPTDEGTASSAPPQASAPVAPERTGSFVDPLAGIPRLT
jgi:hypothetical protein